MSDTKAFDADGAMQREGRGGRRDARRLPQGRGRRCRLPGRRRAINRLISPAEAAISTHKRCEEERHQDRATTRAHAQHLEAEFYKQAVASGAITQPEVRAFATTVGAAHEATHVKTLEGLLGAKGGQEAEVRLRRHRHEPGQVQDDVAGARGHGRGGCAGRDRTCSSGRSSWRALSPAQIERRATRRGSGSSTRSGGLRGTGTSSLPAPKACDKALSEKKVLSAVKKTSFVQG